MPVAPLPASDSILKAHVTSLRLLFAAWLCHFKSLGYIKETTLETLDKSVCKKTLERTVKDPKIREAIGLSRDFWWDLVDVFRAAVPSFEQRTFELSPPVTSDYDGPSSHAIVVNSTTLLKDLQRLDHMLAIARNVLTVGEPVQNVAAQSHFDREVCALICLCIKITAKGYDGEASPVDEDKWQGVINGFKKLLITSLQFLSNLVTMNERLKLMLWVELFDSMGNEPSIPNGPGLSVEMPAEIINASNWVMNATKAFMRSADANPISNDAGDEYDKEPFDKQLGPTPAYFAWLRENRAKIKTEISADKPVDSRLIAQEANRRWTAMSEAEKEPWTLEHEQTLAKFRRDLEVWQSKGGAIDMDSMPASAADYFSDLTTGGEPSKPQAIDKDELELEHAMDKVSIDQIDDEKTAAVVKEFRMLESASDGARKLQEGKDQLLKRLESYPSDTVVKESLFGVPESPVVSPRSPVGTDIDMNSNEAEDEESEEEDESSDEDYAVPGEEGRGLLTDIPLILGPNEIEVLPMIIMSGIVPPQDDSHPYFKQSSKKAKTIVTMHTIRCHLLLAQENGRNLLRELLIFVAAWDLREEELYFKFMVKIMEAILKNSLMPFAYGAFKESKDIISPAQAVIMKLLTKIFHSRQGNALSRNVAIPESPQASVSPDTVYPLRSDIQIVYYLFNEFRHSIIPQICALIFLQGQIKAGKASPDDFPLNLWDMERMYEGVYQYLEFFAILTDHDFWKQMMAEWEVVSELVTLLRELESAIPKGHLSTDSMPMRNDNLSPLAGSEKLSKIVKPVAVERPFDLDTSSITPPLPEEGELPAITETGSQFQDGPQDEPADFEWRNLKKLCVLVLSSLVWKNRKLQDQVRNFDGVMTILSCCAYDEHNPYIREHAIMCLRFLMEGNKENQDIIRSLDAQEVVPSEVLDQHGYETFMDNKGQVGLRRKEALNVSRFSTPSPGDINSKLPAMPTMPTGSLPEWMQMVMKSMPR